MGRKNGHKTPDPAWITFAGVVSRDRVRIALTYAALNGLFKNIGKVALIKRALYGGKSTGSDFWHHLMTCMTFLSFESCEGYPEAWQRKAAKHNGENYWEYMLLCVGDALLCSHKAEEILRNELGKYFVLMEESIGDPRIHLGNQVTKVERENGVMAWSMSSTQHVKAAVDNVEPNLP